MRGGTPGSVGVALPQLMQNCAASGSGVWQEGQARSVVVTSVSLHDLVESRMALERGERGVRHQPVPVHVVPALQERLEVVERTILVAEGDLALRDVEAIVAVPVSYTHLRAHETPEH